MSNYNEEGILMNNYHKCPNSIVDRIAGSVLSPTACVMLLTIMRYTWGMNDRKTASIPHKVFMQKTGIKRAETLGKYVKELTDSGIVNVIQKKGITSQYSINKSSPHISGVPDLDDKSTTDKPLRIISSTTDNTGEVLLKNRTTSTTDNPYSNKDILNKESINKENKEKNKKENPKAETKKYKPEKPQSVSEQVWLDLLTHRKSKKTSNTQTAWTMIFNQLDKAHQATGHTLDQIITEWISRDWKGFKSDWYINKQNTQGNNHAVNQSANTTDNRKTKKSSAQIYEENLARELAEQFPDEFPSHYENSNC